MPAHDPVAVVIALGGIARVRDVREFGVSKDAIRRAIFARRTLSRPRYGVVAIPGLPSPILRAVAAGGALAAVSAAEYYGLWTPPGLALHVSVRADAGRRPDERIVFVRDGERLRDDERFVVSLPTCVRQCIRLLPHDEAVAVVDSALHAGPIGGGRSLDLPRLRLELPRRFHPVIDAADGRAESGAETLARVRLARIGIVARPQVWVTQTIRVDLLIHDRLIVEIGSKEFHADPGQYEDDHARAATLLSLGCDVLEFTTSQIMDDWEVVEGIIADHAERASRQ
jgi:very-short-patch-repair endonuclease